jgi:hypothetical protein
MPKIISDSDIKSIIYIPSFLVSYYYGVPYEGGYIRLYGEDGTPMEDTDPEELKRLWLDDAKETVGKNKLYLIKETVEVEEV